MVFIFFYCCFIVLSDIEYTVYNYIVFSNI